MSGENQRLVADEPVEFKRCPVEVHDFWKLTEYLKGIYGIYLKLMKENMEDMKNTHVPPNNINFYTLFIYVHEVNNKIRTSKTCITN